MTSLAQEIGSFLTENGLSHSVQNNAGRGIIVVEKPHTVIFPIEVDAVTAEEARARSEEEWKRIKGHICYVKRYSRWPLFWWQQLSKEVLIRLR